MTKIKETIKAHPIITTLILLIIVSLITGSVLLIIQENEKQRKDLKECQDLADRTNFDYKCE